MVKVREAPRVRSRALLLAHGVNEEGLGEVLELMMGDSESEDRWSEFMGWLKSPGAC